jgi:hypothetical protein
MQKMTPSDTRAIFVLVVFIVLMILASCSPKLQYEQRIYGTIAIHNPEDKKIYRSDSGYVSVDAGLDGAKYMLAFHTKDGREFGTLRTAYFEPYDRRYRKQLRFRPSDSEGEQEMKGLEWVDTAKLWPPEKQFAFRMAIYKFLDYPLKDEDYSIPYPHPWRKGDTSHAFIWNDTLVITHDHRINIFGWRSFTTKCANPFVKSWVKGDTSITLKISKEPRLPLQLLAITIGKTNEIYSFTPEWYFDFFDEMMHCDEQTH